MLGISERAYRHLEAGTRNPSYKTVKKLRALFGIDDEELLVPDSTLDDQSA
jgi:transcriptional regulator with XRE-family HTH domain